MCVSLAHRTLRAQSQDELYDNAAPDPTGTVHVMAQELPGESSALHEGRPRLLVIMQPVIGIDLILSGLWCHRQVPALYIYLDLFATNEDWSC